MQAKKAKQLLKARLARERQIYEMRKRAELKAAVSELERPWEAVEKPPNLFSVSADEQLKVLADRFQKPGGLDLWTESDGPELFRPDNGLPSSRFFPKGVVHSSRPYRKTEKLDTTSEEFEGFGLEEDLESGLGRENAGETEGNGYYRNSRSSLGGMIRGGNVRGIEARSSDGVAKEGENLDTKGKFRKKGTRRMHASDSEGMNSGNAGFYNINARRSGGSSREFRRINSRKKGQNVNPEVFDLNLQNDGSYGFELES